MQRSLFLASLLTAAQGFAMSDTTFVAAFDSYGPYPAGIPLMIDSTDVNARPYEPKALLDQPLELSAVRPSGERIKWTEAILPAETPSVAMLAFSFENDAFTPASISVEGPEHFKTLVDGREFSGDTKLKPASHRVVIKYITTSGDTPDSVKVTLTSDAPLRMTDGRKRRYGMADVMNGTRIASTAVSPDGRYLITNYVTTASADKSDRVWRVTRTADGAQVATSVTPIKWMPTSSRYYFTRQGLDGKELIAVNPADGTEQRLCRSLPDGRVIVMPDERQLLVVTTQRGPKEDKDIYQVLEPEDRQPGWRNRSRFSLFDMETGITRPITFGHRATRLLDIADDSRHLLFSVSETRLEKRPTTVSTILSLDLATMKADTIALRDGFIAGAIYSPDASEILITGSPEALGGIGNILGSDRIPSMYDYQLFMRRADGRIEPLTRDFNPAVEEAVWSRADGQIYFSAEDRDRIGLFRLDPRSGKITSMNLPEDIVKGFSIPRRGQTAAWYGQSVSNPDRLYTLDTRRVASRLLDEPAREQFADVSLGVCEPWTFVNPQGDSITTRFYLPPDFDPSKRYPMIVNYYGGCSPTSRNFESRYPHNAYAAQGYVVLVIQPSGATGFGQEFASRHVKTAGRGVAEDIIGATREFCDTHNYVDTTRIGCIGASYGGFMTQYLQTLTPMFAAAISHAGISDHTSYWGEGYWGYSYSEVAMGDAHPWDNPELYVGQSPLFRADKITTPLLFLHGDADTNVPPGESIQMFTALKLLGRPTALVEVTGENHHILDYNKRLKWQDTIFAWFAKYLKDEPAWWDALYPPKTL